MYLFFPRRHQRLKREAMIEHKLRLYKNKLLIQRFLARSAAQNQFKKQTPGLRGGQRLTAHRGGPQPVPSYLSTYINTLGKASK